MELEPSLVITRFQRAMMTQDLMNDSQYVIGARTVVSSWVSPTASCTIHGTVLLKTKYIKTINQLI